MLAFEVKRPVSVGLNRLFAVLQLSKCRWTVNRTAVLGLYRSLVFAVFCGPGPVRSRSFSSLVTGLPNTNMPTGLQSPRVWFQCFSYLTSHYNFGLSFQHLRHCKALREFPTYLLEFREAIRLVDKENNKHFYLRLFYCSTKAVH